MKRLILLAVFLSCVALSCDDPPQAVDKGSLLVSIGILSDEGSPIAGFEKVELQIGRIEIIYATDPNDPATEQILLVNDRLQTLTLASGEEAVNVGQFEVPVSFVKQIRFITSSEITPSISLSISGDISPVRLPSGEQTGLKIVPADDMPFEIRKDEVTAVRATFDPQRHVHLNRGQGYMLKPVLQGSVIEVTEVTGGLKPNILAVRFKPEIPRTRVEEINAEIGATILKEIPELNEYKMRVPNSMSIIDGIHFYEGKSETDKTAPVFFLGPEQVAGVPSEGALINQTIINAPNLWTRLENRDGVVNGTVGSREVIVAVIDVGFDLDHPDLIPNWYINDNEIPAILGIVDADGDGVITFIDLNDPVNVGQCTVRTNRNTPFDICDPLDIINDPDWADGMDTDGNGVIDDLVGSDFTGTGDNNPNAGGTTQSDLNFNHGTRIAGIVGAVGDNLVGGTNEFLVAPALDPTRRGIFTVTTGIAGMSWRVRLLPLRMATSEGPTFEPNDADDFDLREALIYARNQGADIVNISLGTLSFKGERPRNLTPTCNQGSMFGDLDKNFGEVRDRINNFYNFNIGDMLIVTSAGNCNVNVPDTDVIAVPKQPLQRNHPNQVIIAASTNTATTSTGAPNPTLEADSARGVGYADIAAPGENWLTLEFGGGTIRHRGTSFAAATVSGAAALILDRNPALRGNGVGLRAAVLRAVNPTVDIPDVNPNPVTGNGRFLDLSMVP